MTGPSRSGTRPGETRLARTLGLAAWALALGAGCGGDFDSPTLITEARVLGSITTVEGDPERATPAPGETLQLRWVVGQPADEPRPFTWTLAACLARPSPVRRPFCVDEPFFAVGETTPTTEAPTATIPVPAIGEQEDLEVLLLGVFCRDGVPDLARVNDPQDLDAFNVCSEGIGQIIGQSLRVLSDSDNLRPRWPANALLLNGAPWPGADECVPAGTVDLAFGGIENVRRDEVTFTSNDEPPRTIVEREDLLLSHFATAGEMERQWSVFDDDEVPTPLEWSIEARAEATRVRFYFGLRDQRGGADFLERELCIAPG